MCAGAAIDRQVIERFWASIGIHEMTRRIEYTFTQLKALFERGPMVVIALMTEVQAQRKFSRGMFLDCLHSVYAIYADLFVSNDEHFRDFRREVEAMHGLKLKLRMLDELQLTKTTSINPERGSFLVAAGANVPESGRSEIADSFGAGRASRAGDPGVSWPVLQSSV